MGFFQKKTDVPVSLGGCFPKFSASNSAWKGKCLPTVSRLSPDCLPTVSRCLPLGLRVRTKKQRETIIFLEGCFEKKPLGFFPKMSMFQFRLGGLFPSFQRPTRLGKGSVLLATTRVPPDSRTPPAPRPHRGSFTEADRAGGRMSGWGDCL